MPHHSSLRYFSGLLVLATTSAAFAFQPLITDDTGTQGKGGHQVEFSYNEDRQSQGGDTTKTHTLPLVYTYGLGDALDVYVAVNHTRISPPAPGIWVSGSGNPALGVKWRFYENEESKTSLAFKPELRLPIDADKETAGLGHGRTSFGAMLILTQEVSFGAVHANLATSRNRFRDQANNPDATTLRASIAPVWDVNEQWKLVLDLGSETETAAGLRIRSTFGEIGAIYSPNKDLDLALGLIRRSDNTSPSATTTSLTLGITWRFK